jgi:thiol-disulfide isomerase/thioredoxin
VRAPVDHIFAPPFPPKLPWINVAALRMDQLAGSPVLIEFWDFCRPNSLRTLPYTKAWAERYREAGLRVIGVHAAGFPPGEDPDAVAGAVTRLQIAYPVVVDVEFEVWQAYGNLGWPARYLFDGDGRLYEYHYGEGGYADTERAIQTLLGVERPLVEPIHATDPEDAQVAAQTEDVPGPYSGPYEAGGVWAILDGAGRVSVNGQPVTVDHPGAYELIGHERSTAGELDLRLGDGVDCYAVCFTPGVA